VTISPHHAGIHGGPVLIALSDVKILVLTILRGVRDYDPYIGCRSDATGKFGFTSYQKCSSTIRMLAYGVAGNLFDEYLRMSETTCL
jgi:hypothetical protein